MDTFNKIKSFVNLITYEEAHNDTYSVSSDDVEDHLIPTNNYDNEELLFGNNTIINQDKFRTENVLLSMLEDIQQKTNDILNQESEKKTLCDEDMRKLEEKFLELKDKIEIEKECNKKEKNNFRKIKYILLGLHTVCITLGIVTFIYYRKNSTESIIKEMETKSFRATRLNNDSWIFKSQPRAKVMQHLQ